MNNLFRSISQAAIWFNMGVVGYPSAVSTPIYANDIFALCGFSVRRGGDLSAFTNGPRIHATNLSLLSTPWTYIDFNSTTNGRRYYRAVLLP